MKVDFNAQSSGEHLRFEHPVEGQPWSIMRNPNTGDVLLGPTGRYHEAWTGLSRDQVDQLIEFLKG